MDEFEVLDQAITRGQFNAVAVQGLLRHLIQHRPRFKVLLATSHTLDELQSWASTLINVSVGTSATYTSPKRSSSSSSLSQDSRYVMSLRPGHTCRHSRAATPRWFSSYALKLSPSRIHSRPPCDVLPAVPT
jgi:hypothetical protein